MHKLRPHHIIVLSFFCAIVAGTILLSLPFATHEGDNVAFVDRLFTATSATCVTGLVVKETASWSGFGRLVIMFLMQAGGLGIMTFSIFFAIALGRKITIREDLVVSEESAKGLVAYSPYRLLCRIDRCDSALSALEGYRRLVLRHHLV